MKNQVENKTLTYMKTIKDVNTDDSRLLSKRAHLKLQKKPKLSPTREYEYERVFSSCAKEGLHSTSQVSNAADAFSLTLPKIFRLNRLNTFRDCCSIQTREPSILTIHG